MALTDAEYATEQTRIQGLLDEWRPRLHQTNWRLTIIWDRDKHEKDSQVEGWTDVIHFEIRAQWQYAQARLYIYCGSTAELSDEAVEECVVHELCHCLVQELQGVDGIDAEYQAHEEHVVTILARAFIATRNQALDN